MAGGPLGRRGTISEINVTPLVDVMLVLLVLLMVTASYVVARSVPVELPAAQTGEPTPSPLAIVLDAAGGLHVDGQPSDDAGLRAAARRARSRGEARAAIAADGSVPHRRVIHAIDLLRQERITQFALQVKAEDVK